MTKRIFIFFFSPSVGRKHQKMDPQIIVSLFFLAIFFYVCRNNVERKVINLEGLETRNHSLN